MNKEKIFILDSEEAYKMAEQYKEKLENEALKVRTFNDVLQTLQQKKKGKVI